MHRDPDTLDPDPHTFSDTMAPIRETVERDIQEQFSELSENTEVSDTASVNVSPQGSGNLTVDSDPQPVHQEAQRNEEDGEGNDTASVNVSPQGSGSLTAGRGPQFTHQR